MTTSTTSSTTTTSTTTTTSSTSTTSSSTTTLPPLENTRKRKWRVWMNNVEITAFFIRGKRIETYGTATTRMELEFTRNIINLITLNTATTIIVKEAFPDQYYTTIFNGVVETHDKDGIFIEVIGKNNLAKTVRNEITHVYDKSVGGDPASPDGKISDIVLDILTTHSGLNADATTVQDSGTGITLSKFICNHADPLERLKKLQETLGWVLYYRDDTDFTYFEPKGYVTNANTLQVGVNIRGIPKWQESKEQMINDLTLEGAVLPETRSETKSGDTSEVTFQLTDTNVPANFEVYYDNTKDYTSTALTQSEHKVGVPESTAVGTFDYTFDLKNRSITFTSFTPGNGSADNILILYTIETPNPIHRVNELSFATYGRFKRTITLSDVVNVDDAEKRCQTIIDKFSQPFNTTKFEAVVSDNTFRVGQSIRVIDTANLPNIDDFFTIIKHTKIYPGNIDEFEVGDKQWEPIEFQVNLLERLKRLEESMVGDTAVVNEIKDNVVSFGLVPDYQQITEERINDSFILGVPPNSIIYDSGETSIISNFNNISLWADTGITTAKATMSTTLGTSGDYLTGTAAIQFTSTEGGAFGLRNTSSFGDLSSCTGTTAGTPSQGTSGVWLETTQISNFTSTLQLNIGKDINNYFTYNSQTYAQKIAADTTSYNFESGWTLLQFDMDAPSSMTGTDVDWTAIGYVELKGTVNAATIWSHDYLTISKNDIISKCGLGERFTTARILTYTF